jgi:hypothetical protein
MMIKKSKTVVEGLVRRAGGMDGWMSWGIGWGPRASEVIEVREARGGALG